MANLEQIKKHLLALKLPFKTVVLDRKAYTVADVVRSGIRLEDVVKTLIVRKGTERQSDEVNKRSFSANKVYRRGFVALALCGNDRVDFKKIRAKFGSKSGLARAEEVLEVVGVPIGAVCPILLEMPIYIDKKVMNLKNVHMGSGDLNFGLEMNLTDFLEAVRGYRVESFCA